MSNALTIKEFRDALTGNMRAEIAKQLPKGIDPDRFIRTAITVVQMHPELLEANRTSLFGAVMLAAKDGLLPDGREATIQIYNTKVKQNGKEIWIKQAQYMPMVHGLLKKMYEAGAAYIDAAAVYEKDHFVFVRGDNPRLEHEPDLVSDDPGKVIAAYAIVKLANGEVKREVMPRRDIEKVRRASKAPDGPGWSNWYDQFAIKAVLKRVYKQIPHQTEELLRVIEHDNQAMGFEPLEVPAAQEEKPAELPPPDPKRSTRLQKLVQQQAEPVEVKNTEGDEEPPAESQQEMLLQ